MNKVLSLSQTMDDAKGRKLSIEIYRFFQNVYPDFYAKSWLGSAAHNKYVDNFMDDVILTISEYRK